ncbi:MAG: hypothetical protein IPI67_37945 [Myxococcales bacterium]|nr:hypothetical protein [Myxococcales bacterium]
MSSLTVFLRVSVRTLTMAALLASCHPPPPQQSGPFQEQRVAGLGNPEIVIVNKAQLVVRLVLSGPESRTIEAQAGATQSERLAPGQYSFEASAPGVQGASGTKAFDVDHRYLWTFDVVEVPQGAQAGGPAAQRAAS